METEELEEKTGLRDKFDDLSTHLGDYVNTYYKLTVLKASQKATNVGSSIFSTVIICTVGFLSLAFLGVALAFWIGDLMESRAGGFLVVGGFLALVVTLLVVLRKRIVFPLIRNSIIRKLYE